MSQDPNQVFLEELCPVQFDSLEYNDRNDLFNSLRSLMTEQQLGSLRMSIG